jgi:hypothetical protein
MALGSTQPLTEMNTSNISRAGKEGRCVGLTTLPPSNVDCLEIGGASTSGNFTACPGLFYLYLLPTAMDLLVVCCLHVLVLGKRLV